MPRDMSRDASHERAAAGRIRPAVAADRLERFDGPAVRYLHYMSREPYFYDVMRLLLEVNAERRRLVVKLLRELRC